MFSIIHESSSSKTPNCLLCPHAPAEEKKPLYPPSDSFLRACKPTEGQGWAHVLCSVFTPEITFTDASRLRLVEGLTTISRHRWVTVSPFLYATSFIFDPCRRNVASVELWKDQYFAVVTAIRSTMHLVHGNKVISSVSKFNL
jgi:hypothetical protein